MTHPNVIAKSFRDPSETAIRNPCIFSIFLISLRLSKLTAESKIHTHSGCSLTSASHELTGRVRSTWDTGRVIVISQYFLLLLKVLTVVGVHSLVGMVVRSSSKRCNWVPAFRYLLHVVSSAFSCRHYQCCAYMLSRCRLCCGALSIVGVVELRFCYWHAFLAV